MPAKSKAQRNLMAAAEHGASFPMAKKARASMTHEQLHDFAATKGKDLPPSAHATQKARAHQALHARGANASRGSTPDPYAVQHSAYNWRSRENLRKH